MEENNVVAVVMFMTGSGKCLRIKKDQSEVFESPSTVGADQDSILLCLEVTKDDIDELKTSHTEVEDEDDLYVFGLKEELDNVILEEKKEEVLKFVDDLGVIIPIPVELLSENIEEKTIEVNYSL